MRAQLKSFASGVLAALIAMVIFALALGCFVALMLLVASMEEGGTTLTNSTMPLTEAMILLSQGVGFTNGPITLTIMPLLLTFMLIALIGVLAARLGTGLAGLIGGLATWGGLNWYVAQGVQGSLLDGIGPLMGKTLLVFAIGYGMVMVPRSPFAHAFRAKAWDPISVQVRRTILVGVIAAALIVALLALAGFATVVVWLVMDYDGALALFDATDMDTGSRIMTSLAMLAWLPNLMAWALSWLAGAGFRIGSIAEFTLWIGQGDGLPALPVFGVLPRAVPDDAVRMALMAVPTAIGFVIGLIVIVSRHGLGLVHALRSAGGARKAPAANASAVPAKNAAAKDGVAKDAAAADPAESADDRAAAPTEAGASRTPSQSRRLVLMLAYPAGSMSLAAALVSLAATVAFALSNGSLGTGRLAHVGVDVVDSTQAVGHGVALGLLSAWLLALVGVAAYFGIRWTAGRVRDRRSGGTAGERPSHDDAAERGDESFATQTMGRVVSSGSTSSARSESAQ